MKVRGLTDKEIEEYFSDMYTLEDYKPYIDGAAELGYRKGLEEGEKYGLEKGREEGLEAGRMEGREEGLEEGREEGLEAGRMEERSSIVLKMKELNIPLEQIMSITGLSAEEVKKYN